MYCLTNEQSVLSGLKTWGKAELIHLKFLNLIVHD